MTRHNSNPAAGGLRATGAWLPPGHIGRTEDKMEYETLNADRGSIVLMRVENGWLIRSDNRATASFTPLRVAETPAALVEIVRAWAEAQVPA